MSLTELPKKKLSKIHFLVSFRTCSHQISCDPKYKSFVDQNCLSCTKRVEFFAKVVSLSEFFNCHGILRLDAFSHGYIMFQFYDIKSRKSKVIAVGNNTWSSFLVWEAIKTEIRLQKITIWKIVGDNMNSNTPIVNCIGLPSWTCIYCISKLLLRDVVFRRMLFRDSDGQFSEVVLTEIEYFQAKFKDTLKGACSIPNMQGVITLLGELKDSEVSGEATAVSNFHVFVKVMTDLVEICSSNDLLDGSIINKLWAVCEALMDIPEMKTSMWLKTSIVNVIVFIQNFTEPLFADILTIRDLENEILPYRYDNLHSTLLNLLNRLGSIFYEAKECQTVFRTQVLNRANNPMSINSFLIASAFGLRNSNEGEIIHYCCIFCDYSTPSETSFVEHLTEVHTFPTSKLK